MILGPNEECMPGTEITNEKRCKEAAHWSVELDILPMRPVYVGNWKEVPLGCSSQKHNGGDDTIHFSSNTESTNGRWATGEFIMICETGKFFNDNI